MTQVEIYGQTFNLPGSDPGYILRLAEYVNSKMHAVAKENPASVSARVAVLAALNIADEYHLLKTKLDGISNSVSNPSEDRQQRNRERRAKHYTQRTHETQLIALANDRSLSAKERLEALHDLARLRGYLLANKKRNR